MAYSTLKNGLNNISIARALPAMKTSILFLLRSGHVLLEFGQVCDYDENDTTCLLRLGHKTSFLLVLLEYTLLNLATTSYNKPQVTHRQTHKEIHRAQLSLQRAAPKLQIMSYPLRKRILRPLVQLFEVMTHGTKISLLH